MWTSIISAVAGSFTKETFASIGNAILGIQVRNSFRRAIQDLVEDEVRQALRDKGIAPEDAKRYVRKNKRRIKEEISNRFDALLYKS